MAIIDLVLNLWDAFLEVMKSFYKDPSIFWFIGPILLFWIVLEVYFSKYKKEELGWNTALGNGLSVFWVLVVSIKFLFGNKMENFEWPKFIALLVILFYSFFIIINSFSHKLEAKISFLLASPTLIYYLSGISILWTYGGLKITKWVLIILVLGYGVVLLIDLLIKKLVRGRETFDDMSKAEDITEKDIGSDLGGFRRF